MDKRVTYLSNLRPNREEPFFIIISTIIIVIDLRVIGIDENEQERISRHFTDNCVQRRVFCCCFFFVCNGMPTHFYLPT